MVGADFDARELGARRVGRRDLPVFDIAGAGPTSTLGAPALASDLYGDTGAPASSEETAYVTHSRTGS
jgi:hypothetical protein